MKRYGVVLVIILIMLALISGCHVTTEYFDEPDNDVTYFLE